MSDRVDAVASLPELAARGAARAADALAALLGGDAGSGAVFAASPEALAALDGGVAFALEGALAGAVALLFAHGAREALVRRLGSVAEAAPDDALDEVANIAASQAVSALADASGCRVALSVPRRVAADAVKALAASLPPGERALASALRLRGSAVRAWLVWFPGATGLACDTVGA